MKDWLPIALIVALVAASIWSVRGDNAQKPLYTPPPVDVAAHVELERDRAALRDTVKDTVWRVVKKAARVKVDTLILTRTDTLRLVADLADSALTCYVQRDSLRRVDSAQKAYIDSFKCPASKESRWTSLGAFAGGTVLGFLLGASTTAVIGGN